MAKNAKGNVTSEANITEGLENNTTIVIGQTDFSSREWLETNDFVVVPELTSSKYEAEREAKVQAGLKGIASLIPSINPLVVLLGKYWENKSARASIKNMIDAEAKAKGLDEDYYLQTILRKQIDELSELQQGIERMKYSITYFKPREGKQKEVFVQKSIDGVWYNISLIKLTEAKDKFADDRNALKEYIKTISTVIDVEEL